jgi:hypothetical protein
MAPHHMNIVNKCSTPKKENEEVVRKNQKKKAKRTEPRTIFDPVATDLP